MNRLNSFRLLYYIVLLFFRSGIKYCVSTASAPNQPQSETQTSHTVNDVTIHEIGISRTVVCIDHLKKAILQCKPKHVLIVHAAQWSNATCEIKKELEKKPDFDHNNSTYLFFNRTESLQHLCDGLSNCFLKPSKTRNETDPVTFLGDPIVYHRLPTTHSTDHYSLTVSVSCLNRDLNVRGRKITDTVNSKEHDVVFGCNEDEVIHLSIARVDGYAEVGPNRSLKEYNFGPHVFDCNLKQKCTVTSANLKKAEEGTNGLEFGTAVLVYYCRKPMKFSFCDHVKVHKHNVFVDNYVLYAEQDSNVTVKAQIFQTLKVESALWSTSDKLTDNDVKKDRVELLKFLCEDRNYCAFSPKRSAAGPSESSFEEVHFGGILRENKSLVLVARFGVGHVKDLKEAAKFKSATVDLQNKLTIQCASGEEGTLHVLSAVAGPKGTTNPDGTTSKPDPDPNSVKYKDLTKVLHKICYRKTTCEWNLNPLGGTTTGATDNPLPAGLANQEMTVKYVCKKYTHDPSLVSLQASPSSLLEMAETLGSPTSTVDKEQAETVFLLENRKLFINLDVYGDCVVKVGDLFTIKLPELSSAGGTVEAYFTDKEATKITKEVPVNCTKFILFLGMGPNYVDFALDASDGSNDVHHTGKLTRETHFNFPILLKDVVTAKGKIVGMRVYMSK